MLFSNYISEPSAVKRSRKSLSRRKKELSIVRRSQAYRALLLIGFGIFCYWLPQTLLDDEFHNHEYGTVIQKTSMLNRTAPDEDNLKLTLKEGIAIYRFPDYDKPKVFKTYDSTLLLFNETNAYTTIQNTHSNGLLHFGTWILIRDLNGYILFLKRGDKVKTCANSWGAVGEHVSGKELVDETIERGIKEELGEEIWNTSVEYTKNLTYNDLPIYLHIDYGDRVDEQLTWIMLVQLNDKHEDLEDILTFDDEVADHVWRMKNESLNWIEEGGFCHDAIRNLMNITLGLML